MSKPFNIRVYGLLIVDQKILILKEPFAGELIYKFPGGGLEYGEGLKDCLIREFKEELNLDISVGEHIYTQDFFLPSRFDPDEQILMIYYKVRTVELSKITIIDQDIAQLLWIKIDDLTSKDLSLPTDQIVVELLKKKSDN